MHSHLLLVSVSILSLPRDEPQYCSVVCKLHYNIVMVSRGAVMLIKGKVPSTQPCGVPVQMLRALNVYWPSLTL